MTPAPIDAVARVLEATEHEVLTWRLLCLSTLDELHAALVTINQQRETICELRACERRLAVSLFGEPQ